MNESSQGISLHTVLDLIPREMAVLVRRASFPWAEKVILDQGSFARFRFDAIKWIRQRPLPEDRCWSFETRNDEGVWQLEKHDALIESRKSRYEKEKEKEYEKKIEEMIKNES